MILSLGWMVGTLATLFVLVCVLMMLVILIQKPKGGGLSGAFGGAGGGSEMAAFGAKTGDVLTWVTVVLFVMFLSLGISLVFAVRADQEGTFMPTDTADVQPTPEEAMQDPDAAETADQIEVDPDAPVEPAPDDDAEPVTDPENDEPADEPADGNEANTNGA